MLASIMRRLAPAAAHTAPHAIAVTSGEGLYCVPSPAQLNHTPWHLHDCATGRIYAHTTGLANS
jgi:hypothetical protein